MKRHIFTLFMAAAVCLATTGHATARKKVMAKASRIAPVPVKPKKVVEASLAEARLIEIYQLVAKMQSREALVKAEHLVRDYPSFQLAQLVYGDLLAAQIRDRRAHV